MAYDRNALIAVFEKKLSGFGYQTPDNIDSLGHIHIGNEEFRLLPSLDDKALVVAARYDWVFDGYEFDDVSEDIIGHIIEFNVDDEEKIIRFIASIPLEDLDEENVASKVGGSARSISAAYSELCEDAEYQAWRRKYEFTPVTHSEFDCSVCGAHISYTPGTCPGCGEVYDAGDGEIECRKCGSVLDEIICPKCHAPLRQWDIN